MVGRSNTGRGWTEGFRKGYSLPSPAASREEEVMNKGSCLLSTWNIPGTMTKAQCAITYLILKTQPQEDCWLCYRGGNRDSDGWSHLPKSHSIVLGFYLWSDSTALGLSIYSPARLQVLRAGTGVVMVTAVSPAMAWHTRGAPKM